MVTKNFKNLCALLLSEQGPNTKTALLKCVNNKGEIYYLSAGFDQTRFPQGVVKSIAYNDYTDGICLGTDGTPASEDDYKLGAMITSGISATVSNTELLIDELGNPKVVFKITVTNTGNEAITIREIGYTQTLSTYLFPYITVNGNYNLAHSLLDRTVLSPALTIEAGDAGIIEYTLKTVLSVPKTVSGVTIEPFGTASGENFVAMIEAARQGTIDLQEDCGWELGDIRQINLGEWTDAKNVVHPATPVFITLSSFKEYENCGNVIQFDFRTEAGKCRMNPTSTTTGGYGASEGRVNCTNIANAMPQYIKDLMRTFSVKVGNSDQTAIETVSNNKLALRSEIEWLGTTQYSIAGEGEQVDLTKVATAFMATKHTLTVSSSGISSSGTIAWLRSPNGASYFAQISSTGGAVRGYANSSTSYTPFGCL